MKILQEILDLKKLALETSKTLYVYALGAILQGFSLQNSNFQAATLSQNFNDFQQWDLQSLGLRV